MNHPTASELFEFIDNRTAVERAGQIASHLAECAQCRRKAELEQSTHRIVQTEPLVKAPDRMAAMVMVNLAPPARDPFPLRILSKLGSLVAMAVVLAVIGLAISRVSGTSAQHDDNPQLVDHIVAPLSDAYRKGIKSFTNETSALTPLIEKSAAAQIWKTVFIIGLSIGVLAAADRVFGRRFIKLRS